MEAAMVMSVVTNLAALSTVHTLNRTSSAAENAQRQLSSGRRITRAADDAAGLGISEGLRAQIGGMTQAVRNTQDGIGVLQLADGALGQMTAIMQRMRDLAVQAGNTGALNADALGAIQHEMDQLGSELDHISATTSFDDVPLLDGTYDRLFQVGANVGDTIRVAIGGPGYAIDRTGLGLSGIDVRGAAASWPSSVTPAVSAAEGTPASGRLAIAGDWTTPGVFENNFATLRGTITYDGKTFDLGSVDYTGAVTATAYITKLNLAAMSALGITGFTPITGSATQLYFTGDVPGAGSTAQDAVALTPTYTGLSGAAGAVTALDHAIDLVGSTRADLGAIQNRFEHTVDRLTGAISDTTSSEYRIGDADMAEESTELSRAEVIMQSGTAMLAQANHSSRMLLKLLQAA
jgi:flagellin-like hook-associated protein FlgL